LREEENRAVVPGGQHTPGLGADALQDQEDRVNLNPRMPVNLDNPRQWKTDIVQSVDMYNDWFMKFAPQAFRTTPRPDD